MEQRTYQPNRRGGVVRRNDELHNRLYKKIEALTAVKQVTPAIQPDTCAEFIYPQHFEFEKLKQTGGKPAMKIIETTNGFITNAEAVYRSRKWVLLTVTLMNGRVGQVVDLKPAVGELYRQPKRLIAVIYDETTGHKSEVEVKAWQPLRVS